MKQIKNELDVDFIGGQGPLTKEEEIAISEYIRSKKSKHKKYFSQSNSSAIVRNKAVI